MFIGFCIELKKRKAKKYELCLGLAVIDFEHWRPIYDENFGSLLMYKDYSMDLEKYNHPFWQKQDLQKEVSISI